MGNIYNAGLEAALAQIKAQREAPPLGTFPYIDIYTHTGNLYSNFSGTHIDARESTTDPIITEDIECEIIEPKQLPGTSSGSLP